MLRFSSVTCHMLTSKAPDEEGERRRWCLPDCRELYSEAVLLCFSKVTCHMLTFSHP